MLMRSWIPFFALVLAAVSCQMKTGGLALSSSPDTGTSVEPEAIVDASTSSDERSVSDGPVESRGVTASGGVASGGITTSGGVAAHGGNSGSETGQVAPLSSGGTNTPGGVAGTGGAVAVSTGGTLTAGGVPSPGSSGLGGADATVDSGVIGPGGVVVFPDAAAAVDASADEQLGSDSGDAPASSLPDASLTLVWSDEFDSSSVAGVDTSKWNYVTWDPRHVNNEAQKYTNRIENVFQDGNGYLVLRALNTPYNGFQYTSGRIETNGKFSFKFGRIEVRARLPAGIGSFPGIVMLGTTGNWPQCGELAIMEQYGQDKSAINCTAYAGAVPGSGDVGPTKYPFTQNTSASSDFHVYSLDWYADHIVFQVDGNEVTRSTFDRASPLYNIAEYIVLDVALGGDKGGAMDASQFPMEMIVDYVRVYSLQ
jgi:beta-glucanase (GH16 family)